MALAQPIRRPDLWFCAQYPLSAIHTSTRQEWSHKLPFLPGLLEDIRTRGMINPLIVLNHRDPDSFHARTVMTGVNRVWCLRQLGYTHAPALVVGSVDVDAQSVPVASLEAAQQYFPDGELYWSASGNPRIRGYSNFLLGQFPSDPSSRKSMGADGSDSRNPDVRVASPGDTRRA